MSDDVIWRATWPDDDNAHLAEDIMATKDGRRIGRVYIARVGGAVGTIWKWFIWTNSVVPNSGHEESRAAAMRTIEELDAVAMANRQPGTDG